MPCLRQPMGQNETKWPARSPTGVIPDPPNHHQAQIPQQRSALHRLCVATARSPPPAMATPWPLVATDLRS